DPLSGITHSLVEQIGVTEDHYRVWAEMEMALSSVLLHCRMYCASSRCWWIGKTMTPCKTLSIPVCHCNHVWCKDCQQTVIVGGPKHSCGGSAASELDSLVKRKGWRYCPNCETLIQKVSGCNHLMVGRLCHVCGGLIVRSAARDEVRNYAITKHYSKYLLSKPLKFDHSLRPKASHIFGGCFVMLGPAMDLVQLGLHHLDLWYANAHSRLFWRLQYCRFVMV
ncbi:hypothetical protein EDC04DRAFT_2566725, partial [Pisolithus marmoratus]